MKTPLDKAISDFHDVLYQARLEDQSKINDSIENVFKEIRQAIFELQDAQYGPGKHGKIDGMTFDERQQHIHNWVEGPKKLEKLKVKEK